MSTDFNIKPVGAPVAAPIVQHVSEAAQHAVATELPASQSVAAVDSSARASTDSAAVRVSISNASVSNQSNQVVIDRDARAVVYQVIDTRTSQVVKQFPEEAVLRRRAYFHTLDLTRDAPQRLRATDRQA
ncbi:flagellar protein FlaG [Bradyrhizobium sp. 190]|uniref:flagellar protein FlaG n=1 Tax=Bradyrhizobium sp. 190 TaxID=2782658 RepID=UPI001FF796ED|nr:flagellar protein FlaG [Bradyrhizobium sp. 190]MCK1511997.1 flagellar protein FlaG [Bradyrhizobium sp. 190]